MAVLEDLGDGRFVVEGDLDIESVPSLLEKSEQLFKDYPSQQIDLTKVSRADSVGVALLVEWFRQAKARQQELRYRNVPAQMMAIIRVAELEDLLPLGSPLIY